MSHLTLDIDLADADSFIDGAPHHLFRELREKDPVNWNPRTDGGPGIWNITKFDDVGAITRDWKRFTSTRGVSVNRLSKEEEERSAEGMLIFMDPPHHSMIRRILTQEFTPSRIRALAPSIEYHANRAIDSVIEQGACNFFDVAAELPIKMISEMLGIPDEDHARVLDWTNRTFGAEDPEYSTGPEDRQQAFQEIFGYGLSMIADRRKNPTSDLTSAMAHGQVDNRPMADIELMYCYFLLLGAGNDTTRTLLLQGVRLFAQRPDVWQAIRNNRSLVPVAIEEVLRLEPSARGMGRMATEDVKIRDVTINAGDQIYLWYVSSNHDADVFDSPDEISLTRPMPPRHHAFGGGGPHNCIGAPLARLQAQIFFNLMLDRIPEYAIDGPIDWARSVQFNTIKRLPIAYAPGARLERPHATTGV
ncbi:MAG: cytochrome P450 [Sphingorhabdus sp.]